MTQAEQVVAIKENLKDFCEKNMKTAILLEACLWWNGNMKWPYNRFANLCKTESMTSASYFKYPNLNFYFCLGYGPSAMIN